MSNTQDEHYDHCFKIVLVGEASVGKTNLLSRYLKDSLPTNSTATVGVEFATKHVPLMTGGTVKAQLWDTAGQERYRAITSAHYRRAVGALMVYDITRQATFDHCRRWMEDLREHAEPDIVIMLVGNKYDLVVQDPGLRQVSHEAGCSFADQEGLLFLETSAYSSYNVEHAFEHLLQEVYNERSRATMDGGDALRDDRNVGIGLAEKFHTIRVANSKSDNNCAC